MANREVVDVEQVNESWKTKTLVVGALLGAVIGLSGAYLMVQRAETHDETVSISVGKGVRLGLIVFTLLRQLATLED